MNLQQDIERPHNLPREDTILCLNFQAYKYWKNYLSDCSLSSQQMLYSACFLNCPMIGSNSTGQSKEQQGKKVEIFFF